MLDTLYPVMDPYQCQAICVDTEGCTAFTWTTADNMLALHCYLFANISIQTSCEECVSGPSSCTCSSEVGCLGDASNIVDEILSVQTEAECQNFCLENPLCMFYTWFNADNTPANFCVLLNSCEDTSPCTGCFSGPPECSPEESTTTTITTPVSEGKFRFASLPLVGGIVYQTSRGVIDQKMYFFRPSHHERGGLKNILFRPVLPYDRRSDSLFSCPSHLARGGLTIKEH